MWLRREARGCGSTGKLGGCGIYAYYCYNLLCQVQMSLMLLECPDWPAAAGGTGREAGKVMIIDPFHSHSTPSTIHPPPLPHSHLTISLPHLLVISSCPYSQSECRQVVNPAKLVSEAGHGLVQSPLSLLLVCVRYLHH